MIRRFTSKHLGPLQITEYTIVGDALVRSQIRVSAIIHWTRVHYLDGSDLSCDPSTVVQHHC